MAVRPDLRRSLGPGDVQVWRASLRAGPAELRRARDLLTREELDRAGRYHHALAARRFVMRRGLLRCLLSRYLGRPGREVALRVDERGKPLLAGDPRTTLQFSLSSSHDTVLYAFASGRAVGIDIERVGAEITAPLGAIVGSDVIGGLAETAADQRVGLGYRCWVRAEACLKAMGAGLPGAGSLLGLGNMGERMAGAVVPTRAGPLRLWDLGRGRVHAAALAIDGTGDATVRVLRL